MQDDAELIRRVLSVRPAWQAETLGDFEYLEGGYSNDNYAFRRGRERYVLRIPQRDRPYVDRELEQRFYRSPGDIRVPHVEALDPRSGVMVSRWENGTLLCDTAVEPEAIVGYLEQLHTGVSPCSRRYEPLAEARRQLGIGRPDAAVVALAARIEWSPAAVTTCHNDLNPWNILCDDATGWVTLDWEWLGLNDPLFDLVTLHQGLALDADLLPAMAEAIFGRPRGQDVQRCLVVFWLREYAWAHAELEHGNDRPEIREQLRVSREKLSALDG